MSPRRPFFSAWVWLVIFACSVALLPLPAVARAITADEEVALRARIAAYEAAIVAGNYPAMVDIATPPPLVAVIAGQFRMTPAAARTQLADLMRSTFSAMSGLTYRFEIERAAHREMPDGTPYLLMPTVLIATDALGPFEGRGLALALLDQGTWYLIGVEPLSFPLLRQAYPAFATLPYPSLP